MKKASFYAKHVGRVVQTNSPTILSAAAVVGVAATGYLAAKAAWKSAVVVEEKKSMERIKGEPQMTAQEKALLVWKLYIPAVGVGATTIFCVVASNRIQARRMAALAAAYAVLSGDFDEYRNKAAELLGGKKSKEIDDKVAEDKINRTPPPQGIVLEEGKSWFCDLSTSRYVKTDRQHVDKARNDMNYYLLHEGYGSLNEMYAFLGMESTGVGNQLGWNAEQQIEIVYTPVLMPDGSSATGFKFQPEPKPDFDSLH